MRIRALVILLAVMVTSGCASTKRITPVDTIYEDIKLAAVEVSSVLMLKIGDRKVILIQEDVSPKIELDDNSDYFEVVSLEGERGQIFELEVTSMCDCLGFRKWAVLADSHLISPTGKTVEAKQVGNPQGRIITGEFSENGTYKLIIVANSKFTGHKMGSIDGYFPSGIKALSLPLTIHPTGSVVVGWSK